MAIITDIYKTIPLDDENDPVLIWPQEWVGRCGQRGVPSRAWFIPLELVDEDGTHLVYLTSVPDYNATSEKVYVENDDVYHQQRFGAGSPLTVGCEVYVHHKMAGKRPRLRVRYRCIFDEG